MNATQTPTACAICGKTAAETPNKSALIGAQFRGRPMEHFCSDECKGVRLREVSAERGDTDWEVVYDGRAAIHHVRRELADGTLLSATPVASGWKWGHYDGLTGRPIVQSRRGKRWESMADAQAAADAYLAAHRSYPDGTRVRFAEGVKPLCDGIEFVVDGDVKPDNTGADTRWFVSLVVADDAALAPSKRRGRNAYADELVRI